MKQFHRTSYSKNKGSEDIVYRSVTGDYSISQEAFLDSDPALRAEDYAFFKRWSDENYRAEDSRDAKEARRVLPLEHISALSAPAGEEGICADGSDDLRSLENAQRILNAAALTPVQKRRQLVLHFRADLRFRSCISQCGLSYFFRDFPERSSVLEKQHLTGFFDG